MLIKRLLNPSQLWVLFSFFFLNAYGQSNNDAGSKSPVGSYEFRYSKSSRFNIIQKDSQLLLHVVGQGTVPLQPSADGSYVPDIVKPKAAIRFIAGSDSSFSSLIWTQRQDEIKWRRAPSDSSLEHEEKNSAVGGMYLLSGRPLPLWIKENDDKSIRSLVFSETALQFNPDGERNYLFKHDGLEIHLEFSDLKNGKYQQITQRRKGPLEFVRVGKGDDEYYKRISNQQTGFSHEDSLQGSPGPLRTAYDVLFYNLDLKLDPVERSISGSNLIRFRVVNDFNRMQIDLFRNMKISGITWQNKSLDFARELNAVYIDFPKNLETGNTEEIVVTYEGNPQPADLSSTSGGFMWSHDRNGHDWIEVVTQGIGASLWWPCKDHLSDEPDSMQINVTLPVGMQNISNGMLRKQIAIGDTLIRTEWFVSYPINIYNVTMNIGDYRKLTDSYISSTDTLALTFYYLPYNYAHAKQLMKELKRMLPEYENMAGPYPFKRDGLTVLEAPYPMEHQGAVSIGSINDPIYTNKTNSEALQTMMWHEVGHEWWGNNVSMSDNADIWFHEAFATYLEIMNQELLKGKKETIKKLYNDVPANNDKMVGEYGVNHFKLNSVYSKGALLVHTLRSVIANDTIFFTMLKGIQKHFALTTINSDSIVNYICQFTRLPLEGFFMQYLRYPGIPKLEMNMHNTNGKNVLRYRWKTDVGHFWLPVRLLLPGQRTMLLKGTNEWQETRVEKLMIKQIKIDKDYYVELAN